MNAIYAVLTSILLTLGFSNEIPYNAIESAFERNDSKGLVELGKAKILINIEGKEGVYSKQQATLVLDDFFKRHKGNAFDFIFRGKQSADGTFAIGNYLSGGSSFRVTIHFSQDGGSMRMESLTIEKG